MKVNADKYDPLTTTNEERDISVGGEKIQSSKSEKLLGVIDNKLSFTDHVHNKCVKASEKLNACAKLSSFMSLEKRRLTMRVFVNSQCR